MEKVPTGNKALDEWLNGGYEKGIITCFYGPFATGKTNFCLMAVAEALKAGKRVVYIDTEGGLSIERLGQICKGLKKIYLKNLIIIKPTSFKEQIEAFNTLLKLSRQYKIDMVVVDSIGMLYRLELGLIRESERESEDDKSREKEKEKIRRINLMLATQLRILSEIARKQNIAVLVTNQVYQSPEDNEIHMVGGDLLKYWSKCLIELEHLGNKRKLKLIKHRSLPQKEFFYRIVESGIAKA
jgi:DNA repair protein RadB